MNDSREPVCRRCAPLALWPACVERGAHGIEQAEQQERRDDRHERQDRCASCAGTARPRSGAGTSSAAPQAAHGRGLFDQRALVEVQRVVGVLGGLRDRGSPSAMVLPWSRLSARSSAEHFLGRLAVEVAGGLVADQQRRVGDDRARDRDALLLAARELGRLVARAVGQADQLQRDGRALACARPPTAWSAAAAARRCAAPRASASGCRTGTRSRPATRATCASAARAELVDALAADGDAAAGRHVEPADQVQQRRLARARRAHQAPGTRPRRRRGRCGAAPRPSACRARRSSRRRGFRSAWPCSSLRSLRVRARVDARRADRCQCARPRSHARRRRAASAAATGPRGRRRPRHRARLHRADVAAPRARRRAARALPSRRRTPRPGRRAATIACGGTSTPRGAAAAARRLLAARNDTRTPMSGTRRASFCSSATRTLTVALPRSAVGHDGDHVRRDLPVGIGVEHGLGTACRA